LPKTFETCLLLYVSSVFKCSILALFCSNISNYIKFQGGRDGPGGGAKFPGEYEHSTPAPYFPRL